MLKTKLLAVIVVLLCSVVGYMAVDRNEKVEHQKNDKAFDASFAK
jgi:hypothetical protein